MKAIWKFRFFLFLLIPLVLVGLVLWEGDEIPKRDISSYFPKEKLRNKENMVFLVLEENSESPLSIVKKKELSRTIIRVAERFQIPDGNKIGELTPRPDIFLLSLAKARSNFSQKLNSKGLLDLNESHLKKVEEKFGFSIDRKWDSELPSIQYKVVLLLLQEELSQGKTLQGAYNSVFSGSSVVQEWEELKTFYISTHKKALNQDN